MPSQLTAQDRVAVFGGAGFMGRYVVEELARTGARLLIASRDPKHALARKTAAPPGQIVPVAASLTHPGSVEAVMRQADRVVNLVGILYPQSRQGFDAIHHKGVETLAKCAAKQGIKDFIHISALGADSKSASAYAKSKGRGEKALLKHFPTATILRPSVVFGPGDGFFTRFATMAGLSPFLPLIGGGKTRFQPVYAGDVAKAVRITLERPEYRGEIFELGGPDILTFRECLEILQDEIGRRRIFLPIPFPLASFLGAIAGIFPKPFLTADQVRLLRKDNVASTTMPGFKELGISPVSTSLILPTYMDAFRLAGQFYEK